MFASAVVMSSSTSLSEEASTVSSGTRFQDLGRLNPMVISTIISPPQQQQQPQKIKKKRNLPGNPNPDDEVIALSPKTLLATNRFMCEICNKGFKRDQNLQLHKRGHNLPWKLKQRENKENSRKKVYVCPEASCVHHHPSRALGDLTGIKKHFCRKHGEKKWKCDKCSKIYAVQSDWKAHTKTCGTREYRCGCGTLFSRKDSFVTHRAFCDALAEETARVHYSANQLIETTNYPIAHPFHQHPYLFPFSTQQQIHPNSLHNIYPKTTHLQTPPPPEPISSLPFFQPPPPTTNATSVHISATALLQKAANLSAQPVGHVASTMTGLDMVAGAGVSPEYMGFPEGGSVARWQKSDRRLTRDFLGLTAGDQCGVGNGSGVDVSVNVRNLLSFTGGVELPTTYEHDQSLLKAQGFGFVDDPPASEMWG